MNRQAHPTRSILSLLLVSVLVIGLVEVLSPAAAFAQTTSRSGFIYNGFDHVSFWFNEYSNFDQPTGAATDSRNALAATGANWTSILVTQYMPNSTANTIAPEPSGTKTPTDASIIVAIQDLHSKGIKVMLKPHVDSLDGIWRGQIHPTDTNAWFQSYTTFITHYAQLAQQNGVEGLIMGTEFVTMSGSQNRAQWLNVIAAIRAVYPAGILTYAANATFSGDEFTSVSFWDQLDIMGLDAYFPLTNHADPTIAELVSAWSINANNDHVLAAIQNFAAANQKPLMFTELGYKSAPGANMRPYDFNLGNGGPQDQSEQANCYEAMFEVWSQQTAIMKGVLWWDWPVPPPAAGDTDYNPRNKQAITVLQSWQGPANGGDFTISATPSSQTIPQNTNGNFAVTITPSSGFTSAVNLSVGALPPGVTASFSPASTASTSTLTVAVSLSAPNGTFPITLTAIGGGRGHSTTVNISITSGQGGQDFSLSANPGSLTVTPGASGTSTISVTPSGGFTGSVALTASGLPSGVTAGFTPASTTGTSTLTLSASSTAAAGTTAVTITGTSGSLIHSTPVSLTVSAPDFSLSASPASLTVNRGASGTSTIGITRIGGFASAVSFTASGLPTGVTASFNPVTTTTTGTSSVLTLAASATATAGTATVTITATGGGVAHTITVTLSVAAPDFALAASPASLTIARGASGTSTITATPSGSFAGSVALAASGLPTGVTAAFNPTSTTGTSVLTLTASATATVGAATITVTGTSGTLSHTTTVALTVTAPDFSLSLSPAALTVNQGASGTDTIGIARTGGFTGAVACSVSGLPAGVTATLNPATATTGTSVLLTLAASSTAVVGGPVTVTITCISGSLTHTVTLPFTIASGSGTGGVTATPVVNTNSPYYNEEDVRVANTASITALSLTIVVQRTTGISFSGQYNTIGGQITQGNSSTATAVTYTYTLGAGQTITPGSYLFAAQSSGTGTLHPTAGDTFTVTYTTGGQTFTQSGHF